MILRIFLGAIALLVLCLPAHAEYFPDSAKEMNLGPANESEHTTKSDGSDEFRFREPLVPEQVSVVLRALKLMYPGREIKFFMRDDNRRPTSVFSISPKK